MKKLIALLLVMFSCLSIAGAQTNIRDVQTATYYGIDYSQVRVFGARETDEQFKGAFPAINLLVLDEQKKYNLRKTFNIDFPVQDIETALGRSRELGPLRTNDSSYRISDEDIRGIVSAYGGRNNSGVGLVIIAQLYNKQANQGVYKVVFFDLATKDIIYMKDAAGKAKGFGLRNFWAGSLYQVLKKWKY